MNIKSYTDLEQSKKLVEILPLESADMYYWWKGQKVGVGHSKELQEGFESRGIEYIPAWSLSALLDVLPEIQGSKPVIALDDNYITYPHMSNLHTKADNLIDACVQMIIKLKGSNLL